MTFYIFSGSKAEKACEGQTLTFVTSMSVRKKKA